MLKKLELALVMVIVADIIALIFEYPVIYSIIVRSGWGTYDLINFG